MRTSLLALACHPYSVLEQFLSPLLQQGLQSLQSPPAAGAPTTSSDAPAGQWSPAKNGQRRQALASSDPQEASKRPQEAIIMHATAVKQVSQAIASGRKRSPAAVVASDVVCWLCAGSLSLSHHHHPNCHHPYISVTQLVVQSLL